MPMMTRIATFTLALALAVTAVASAQTLTGSVAGKVVDEQGAVLPGVTVTLTGKTGAQTQQTDGQGDYRFIGLTPGAYTVKVDLQGFVAKEQNATVGIGQEVGVNVTMTVGGRTETVDVVANALSVDATTSKTDTNMSQELLFSMPITHANPAVTLLNYAPGINNGAAFGGASAGANALMLDGVDTRDPEGGTAWTFYNYNIIDEVQVGSLGQPAEYGGFTGAVINTLTKSGGNRLSSLAEYRFTNDGLGSNNVSDEVIEKNATLATPVQILSLKDYTVQLGGPIKKDKLFYFGSVQRYNIEQYNPPIRTEVSPRFNFKLTSQATRDDNIVASLQYDQYNQTGRTALIPGYAVSNQSQTIDQDSPEYIWNVQYRKVFGSTAFLEAKYTGWWGYYDLNPVTPEPTHFDGLTSSYSGGAGYTAQYDRTRNQVNASLSKYTQAAGQHAFKFGIEIERSTIRDRFAYSGATAAAPTGAYYYDYGGPYIAYGYAYDLKGTNKRESYYAQDQWKTGRLTANIGLRLDSVRGEASTTGEQLYSTTSWGPRLGIAYDVTGRGNSVLRAYYGQLYEAAVFASWSRAVPGLTPTFTYEVGADGVSLFPIDSTERHYSVAKDNLKQPRVDEFNLAYEHKLSTTLKVTATGIWRDWKNFVNSTLNNAIWRPITVNNSLTSQPMTIYQWANRTDVPEFTIANIDTVNYRLVDGSTISSPEAHRTYRGMMLVLQRALKNRWQAQWSYVASKTEGSINNSAFAGISSAQFETPNTGVINTDGPTGFDVRHEMKVFGSYQIPKIEVMASGYWLLTSGTPYHAQGRFSASTVNWTAAQIINLQAPGSNRNDTLGTFDLRLEKLVNVANQRFGVYTDMSNLFNAGVVTSRQVRHPNLTLTDPATGDSVVVDFGDPRTMNAARQITFGFRWSF
jgi:hypothetical protein